jgi:hypothetical protein
MGLGCAEEGRTTLPSKEAMLAGLVDWRCQEKLSEQARWLKWLGKAKSNGSVDLISHGGSDVLGHDTECFECGYRCWLLAPACDRLREMKEEGDPEQFPASHASHQRTPSDDMGVFIGHRGSCRWCRPGRTCRYRSKRL